MQNIPLAPHFWGALFLLSFLSACPSEDASCPPGTSNIGGRCLPTIDASAQDAGLVGDDAGGEDASVTSDGGMAPDADAPDASVPSDAGMADACVSGTEVCNGSDDDCDGRIDEGADETCGSDVGLCTLGSRRCVEGELMPCDGVMPAMEVCEGTEDEDCDGAVDNGCACTEGESRSCGSDTGECSMGTQRCTGGAWQACEGATDPSAELCDGLDNDCDGDADEDNPEGGASCGSDTGVCQAGTQTCEAGTLVCAGEVTGSSEACNNLDDDCDGDIDEGNPEGGALCGTNIGACSQGMEMCTGGSISCAGAVGPSSESCDNVDNDCDGDTDEGVQTEYWPDTDGDLRGDASAAATTACSPPADHVDNNTDCDDGCPTCFNDAPELCDGLDNDCNRANGADDTFACVLGETIPCTTSCGTTGSGTCELEAMMCIEPSGGDCTPPAETCNGIDDDCDGEIDDGVRSWTPARALGSLSNGGISEVLAYRDRFVAINLDGDGNLVIQRFNADGTTHGSAATVATGAANFDATMLNDRELAFVFITAGSGRRLRARKYNLVTGTYGSLRTLSSNVLGVAVAIAGTSNAATTRIRYAYVGTDTELFVGSLRADMTPLATALSTNQEMNPITYRDIAMADDGGTVVMWRDEDQRIRAAEHRGNSLGSTDTLANVGRSPTIAADGSGTFLTTWTDETHNIVWNSRTVVGRSVCTVFSPVLGRDLMLPCTSRTIATDISFPFLDIARHRIAATHFDAGSSSRFVISGIVGTSSSSRFVSWEVNPRTRAAGPTALPNTTPVTSPWSIGLAVRNQTLVLGSGNGSGSWRFFEYGCP